jgi:cell division protease FtsH
MSDKPARTVGMRKQPADEEDVSLDVEYISDLPMPLPQLDPIEVAAGLLVAAALAADPLLADVGKAPGAVVVLLCPAGWQSELDDAWRSALGLVRPTGQHWPDRDRKRAGPLSVVSVDDKTARIDAEVRLALRDCRGVVVSAPNWDAVSTELLATADAVVHVPPLSAPMLQEVAAVIGDGEALLVSEDATVGVMPFHLLAARRLGQTAKDFIDRLARIMTGTRPKPLPPVPGLDDLHGMSEAVKWGRALAQDLQAYRAGKLAWADVDRGCLLSGPPGTGKTSFTRRLAVECGVAFVATSFSAWDSVSKEGHLSGLQKAMRQSFAEAKQAAPCIMLIDELDSIPARGRTRYDDYWTPVVNCLLECLDGIGGREGVVVVAASNHPDKIDPGILRSGRLDRRIHIGLPDTEALQAILHGYVGDGIPVSELQRIAVHGAALGSTGADVERWCRGARRRARAAGHSITSADLLAEAVGRQRHRSPQRMRQVAYHEAGHALLVALRRPGLLQAVSILQSGQAGGGASWQVEPGGDALEDLDIVIRELLAGRAAEELVVGVPGGGSGGPPESDLARASLLAASAEMAWGLGKHLVWRGDPTPETLPRLLAAHPDVAARVEARLRVALQEATEILAAHRGELDALAAALVERQALSGAEAEAVIAAAGRQRRRTQELRCDLVEGPSV